MIVFKDYLLNLLVLGVQIYFWIVLFYCIATFFVKNRYAPWFVFIQEIVEPPIKVIRKLCRGYTRTGNFDFAPIILFFLLKFFIMMLQSMIG